LKDHELIFGGIALKKGNYRSAESKKGKEARERRAFVFTEN
jgi:hypothetical protein